MSSLFEKLEKLSPAEREEFQQRLAKKGLAPVRATIEARTPSEDAPLSFAQQRLWFVQQIEPSNIAYNVGAVLGLTGNLDVQALQNALNWIVERHASLRTRFVTTKSENRDQQSRTHEPRQCVIENEHHTLTVVDLTHRADATHAADDEFRSRLGTPFKLDDRLLRLALLKLAEQEFQLIIVTHHIVCDRWSVMVFLRELSAAYEDFANNQKPTLQPLGVQYADWATWQRQNLSGDNLERTLEFWRERLSGALPILELPYDRPAMPGASPRGAAVPITIRAAIAIRLKAIAADHKVSLFTLMLAVAKVLLHHYDGGDDIVVGSEVANRDRPETAPLIGLLVNTLVMRTDVSGDPSFGELLARVKETVNSALREQDLPFEKLVEVINPERDLDQLTPLFDVKVDLQQIPVRAPEIAGVTFNQIPIPQTDAKYVLRFNLHDGDHGIGGQIEYSKARFDAATIERIVSHYQALLEAVCKDPNLAISRLPLLDDNARQFTVAIGNGRAIAPVNATIHGCVLQQANKTPNAIAITDGYRHLDYETLMARSGVLARQLRDKGVRLETPVGIFVERGLEMVIAMLGILRAGGTYVPLDKEYPRARIAYIGKDANLSFAICDSSSAVTVFDAQVEIIRIEPIDAEIPPIIRLSDEDSSARPETLSHIIYTSGSTGQPKGVAIEHRNTVAMIEWAKQQFEAEELAGVFAATSICFDLSVFEIFVPLCNGGTVVVGENALALANHPARESVTLLNTVPSLLFELLKRGPLPDRITTINLAGEALPPNLVRDIQTLGLVTRLYNLYGPSEDTTYSTGAELLQSGLLGDNPRVPIGMPISGSHAYVLDKHLEPVPCGVPGELFLAGAGIARGYRGQPRLTAERFVPNPFASADFAEGMLTLYKTGDRVKRRADGQLEFLGRLDQQLKIRGYRIEAGEVEATLAEHAALEEVAIIAYQDPELEETRHDLVAYYCLNDNDVSASTLRSWLAERLPRAFVPNRWQRLNALPRLPNGKLDRASLPAPIDSAARVEYAAPRSEIEQQLTQIWSQVLERERIGIDDDFFDLGGHSLLAIELVARIEGVINHAVPLRSLFQFPTIALLASAIEARELPNDGHGVAVRAPVVPDPGARYQPFPLTDIQHAYWMGRERVFELGEIGTHGYREIETRGFSIAAVEAALNTLIARHDMLRALVLPDGQQQILAHTPSYSIAVLDCREASPHALENAINETRSRLSHQVFDPAKWPLFSVEAIHCPDDSVRFAVSFDVLIGDAFSLELLGRDMRALLAGRTLEPLSLSFRDYVVAEQAHMASPQWQQDLAYWQNRIPTLPAAPALPTIRSATEIEKPEFTRRAFTLAAKPWAEIKARARACGLSPSAALLTAFGLCLAQYTRRAAFTVNLTLFNRHPVHPEVNQLVGDFTSSLLLEMTIEPQLGFAAQARLIQSQLWEDLEHRAVSGVRVLRDLAQMSGRTTGALMPVVFTSTLDQNVARAGQQEGEAGVVYGLSQTSQVYLDHQVSEVDGELRANWDSIDALFPPGVLDEMFEVYQTIVQKLYSKLGEGSWNAPLTPPHPTYSQSFNATARPLSTGNTTSLAHLFFEQAMRSGSAAAVLSPELTLDYDSLARTAIKLAEQLRVAGVNNNELVAVSLEKGWRQVAAVLGILAAGGAYVPIDPALPLARRQQMFADSAARIAIIETDANASEWSSAQCLTISGPDISGDPWSLPPIRNQVTDLAYVIYTSGSTGTPKGVMIDHRGALNTCLDINERLKLHEKDRIFALSSLSFDLSVYDIFGPLAAGAALVMPEKTLLRDPAHWRERIQAANVTVWNSVPALMQLYIAELASHPAAGNSTGSALRAALLSGDWIPVSLPEEIRGHCPNIDLFSLGGATEASIWSIIYPIGAVDRAWRSIPYGQPLTNQTWYVLNDRGDPCPPWVTGELCIGGVGVARGYWQRPQLSAEKFIPDPFAERAGPAPMLYRTGDLGRYLPNGNIEFLGREDDQVKVGGNRVELGEIAAVLEQHPAISAALANIPADSNELIGYVVPALDNSDGSNPLAGLASRSERPVSPGERDGDAIVLAPVLPDEAHLRRQSHRQFLPDPVEIDDLAALLANLHARDVPGGFANKFRYPSAGGRYPVQVIVEIRNAGAGKLSHGWFFYDATAHQLLPMKTTEVPPDSVLYSANQGAAKDRAFAIYFLADLNRIEPSYGERARDFCLLEAGYMGQLLMEQAPRWDLGLCPINDPGMAALTNALGLADHHIVLHGLLGGAIDPAWNTQWMATLAPSAASFQEQLTEFLEQRLPGYMVPSRFMLLDAIPLSGNGKVDRRALPIPNLSESVFAAPTNDHETRVTEIWQRLLNVEKVGIDDDFFQLGGNSMRAVQLLTELRHLSGAEIAMSDLFAALTPREQALLLKAPAEPAAAPPIPLLDRAVSVESLAEEDIDAMLNELLTQRDGPEPK